MPILNTRDVRATRFESSASNDTETNILKGPFAYISRIVGISRRTNKKTPRLPVSLIT